MKLTKLCVCHVKELCSLSENPYRSEVLSWYRRCIKASFTFPWESDDDALYVLQETRRLFNQNMHIHDVETIERKLREAEMRYGLAIHYNIPYPRMFHKTQGSTPESGIAYAPELDSSFDSFVNPAIGVVEEGSANFTVSNECSAMNVVDYGDSDDNYSVNDYDNDDNMSEFSININYTQSKN